MNTEYITPSIVDARLAIEGGSPVRTSPFAPWPHFDEEQIDAVAALLRAGKVNYWTGDEGKRFEEEFADYVGVRHAVAVANGTTALELALRAAGVQAGDDVVVPCRTFIASAASAVMIGARPIMADIDRDTQNLTVATLEAACTPRTKAVIAVHLAGWPCDMMPLREFADRRGLVVIEDCAQAHGAVYRGRRSGSLGHIAAFSFCNDKIISTGGEGGMITTNDEQLWQRAWSLKDHGKSWAAVHLQQHPPGFRWLHEGFGTNSRMTELQAAIGRRSLAKLDDWLAIRRGHARRLNMALEGLEALRITIPPADIHHAYYKYYVFVRPERLRAGWDRDRLMTAICAEGIPCFSGSCGEIYREKAFPATWRPRQRFTVAKELAETSLMFPVHPTLQPTDIDDIGRAVRKVVQVATVSSYANAVA